MTSRPAPGRSDHAWPAFPGVHVRTSERSDGDFHIEQPAESLEATRRRFVDLPWSQPDEVHGTHVGVVGRAGECDREVGDALVTDRSGLVLGIWVGDCAPVAFAMRHPNPDRSEAAVAPGAATGSVRIGAAHAGWRGLLDGVLRSTVDTMRRSPFRAPPTSGAPDASDASDARDASDVCDVCDHPVEAVLGPCIHPCCYEFGDDDLARVVARFGPSVVSTTSTGRPALDMPAAVRAALAELGVALIDRSTCTGCAPDRYFSHRMRRERGRHVMAVWKDAGMEHAPIDRVDVAPSTMGDDT